MQRTMPPRRALAASVAVAFGLTFGFAGSTGAKAERSYTPFSLASSRVPDSRRTGGANRDAGRNARSPLATRPAGSILVTNCDDSGPGSLRDALADAVDGDTIDLTMLDCSTISLTTGELVSNAGALTLEGPGRNQLFIDGNGASRVLHHDTGALEIRGLTLRNGYTTDGIGGCTWIRDTLTLRHSAVTDCRAGNGANTHAYGAGIDVVGDLVLEDSIVSGNEAIANGGNGEGMSFGGGIYASGVIEISSGSVVSGNLAANEAGSARGGGVFAGSGFGSVDSTIRDNEARSGDGATYGGGVHVEGGNGIVTSSLISGNVSYSRDSQSYGGGIATGSYFSSPLVGLLMVSSAVSGNTTHSDCDSCSVQGGGAHAFGPASLKYGVVNDNLASISGSGVARGGGIGSYASDNGGYAVTLWTMTISGNIATHAVGGKGSSFGGGVSSLNGSIGATNSTVAFNRADSGGGGLVADSGMSWLTSTIVAMNSAPAGADIGLARGNAFSIIGDHNLVRDVAAGLALPDDTIDSPPGLYPLANNGGVTRTHALAACSPAVDAGDNPQGYSSDQRRAPFERVFGEAVDIGAFELQPDTDTILRNGFDPDVGCN